MVWEPWGRFEAKPGAPLFGPCPNGESHPHDARPWDPDLCLTCQRAGLGMAYGTPPSFRRSSATKGASP